MAATFDRITLARPDDWHLHVRDGAMLRAVLPFTARVFGRAIIMPNLVPPVATTADAAAYRARVEAALPPGARFTPLMTAYLRDATDPDDIAAGFHAGVLTAVKLYPAHATTNAAAGVTGLAHVRRVLERMEKIGMPLLIHGEEVDPAVDIFDREAMFIERRLLPLLADHPGLKVVLEHVSTRLGVDCVRAHAPQLAGTITPHHLAENRNAWLGHGLKPHLYCLPVIKRESDRLALVEAATSGEACFFLGTDSAPHPVARKLAPVSAAGVFNAPVAIETYAETFDRAGRLDRLEAFASLNGPRHYGLPANAERITLVRSAWTAPAAATVEGPEAQVAVYRGGETIAWRLAEG
jgi:dihydroorotase